MKVLIIHQFYSPSEVEKSDREIVRLRTSDDGMRQTIANELLCLMLIRLYNIINLM